MDELVVYSLFFFSNNLYFALLICIEHFFTIIELYTDVENDDVEV